MTLDLEDRLREFYAERTAHLPSTGPGLHDLTARAAPQPVDHAQIRLRVGIALGAAAAIAVLAFAVTNRSERAPNATTPELGWHDR